MGSYWRNTSHLYSAMWSQRLWVLQVGEVAWKSAASRVFHQPVFLRSFGFGNEAVKQWPRIMLVPVVPTHLKTWPNHPRWSWNKQKIVETCWIIYVNFSQSNGMYDPTMLSQRSMILAKLICIYIYAYTSICNPPCNLGGGWDPRFCRGPQRQVPCGHSTKSISSLQGRDLPSTKSRAFHTPHIWQKKSCFLQNQGPHMWRHQKKSLVE